MSKRTSAAPVTVAIECKSCKGTGLYVGLAERDGTAVVCHTCHGTGETKTTYRPFVERQPAPKGVQRVHLAMGYVLSTKEPRCSGGVPVQEWAPGVPVPPDEPLYCPYLFTGQEWCAFKETKSYTTSDGEQHTYQTAPIGAGMFISSCPRWPDKAACWERYHADPTAPQVTG